MIPIKNIYYMLSYAFKVLNKQGYKSMETEMFENTADLCSAILIKGVSVQIKRGLGREYLTKSEAVSSLYGKIDISESIKPQILLKKQLVCYYDDFSIDSYLNRIMKSTFIILLRSDISKTRKKAIRKLLIFFSEVREIDFNTINWNVRYNKNNQTYHMLISVCWLIIKGLLQTNSDGSVKLMDFFDEQSMCRLYEKFILEFCRKEYPCLEVNASQIPWALDNDINDMLPIMQSDVMLASKENVLIIDAKYYSHITSKHYDSYKLHSNNLYQIFTYVKNKKTDFAGKVSGLLLYAKTDEDSLPDGGLSYSMNGDRISVNIVDLSMDFENIKYHLRQIIDENIK